MTTTHRFATTPALATLLPLLIATGCADDDTDATADCPADLVSGDLVISEIMANGSGDDAGREWWEIYNASSDAIVLDGFVLTAAKVDGTDAREHSVGSLTIGAGEYLVVGNVAPDALPSHVAYGYGEDLSELANAGGKLSISCGTTVLDEAVYVDPPDGASLGFTGIQAPDALANDDLGNWCEATMPYDGESLGSPGTANEHCPGSGTPTECEEGGETRDLVSPTVGDLVITEIMANPSSVPDGDGEWIEVAVLADVDLNGLQLGKIGEEPDQMLSATECLRVTAGSHVVFASNLESSENGGLPTADHLLDFGLTNSNSSLVISHDGMALDEVTWASVPDGAARKLDPSATTPEANDDDDAWCAAETAYGDGDAGTPGEANPSCDSVPTDECLDGGELRPPVAPVAGDIVITELMQNPETVPDGDGEWFEALVTADFDLNGLEIGRAVDDPDQTLVDENCLSVTAGTRLLFAANPDQATNGGLPTVDHPLEVSLTNNDGNLVLGHSGTLLDEVTWASSEAGAARNLDPSAATPDDNDVDDAWCPATAPYGDGDLGTPGAENTACAGGDSCLDEGEPRPIVSPAAGELVITELMPNPDAVPDADGEWFEVLATADVDLNGLGIGKVEGEVLETVDSVDCVAVAAGTRVLFARDLDGGVNGGLEADLLFSSGLSNTDSALVLSIADETVDAVTWASSPTGAARSLDPDFENTTDNDVEANWCEAVPAYGDGDLGTPGEVNLPCIGEGDGECLDGNEARAIVPPTLGDLIITEVLPNPDAVTDANGEWFEVRATADVDLNGLQIGTTFPDADLTLQSAACLSVSAGDDVLFARKDDELVNGGLPAVDHTFTFSIVNADGSLFLGYEDALLDAITWTSSAVGATRSLDPGSLDTAANDDENNWCDGATPYGDGDLGTPDADNEVCP